MNIFCNPWNYNAHFYCPTIRQRDINAITPDQKLQTLINYAPLVYLDKEETFYPSSVEWSFPYFKRVLDSENRYILETKEELDCPDRVLNFFHGDHQNLSNVPIYAFWVDKENNITDLIYWLWYPYNRGKLVAGVPFVDKGFYGNHVGDWEHIIVRLKWLVNPLTNQETPHIDSVFYSQHAGDEKVAWNNVEKYNGTHPIVYSGRGSHANYPTAGDHQYSGVLTDHTSKGAKWETWNNVQGYDYNNKQGINTTWPSWMWTCYDYTLPGLDPKDPSSGPIYRWGNDQEVDCIPVIGECLLGTGPSGPPRSKATIDGVKELIWKDAIGGTDYCPK